MLGIAHGPKDRGHIQPNRGWYGLALPMRTLFFYWDQLSKTDVLYMCHIRILGLLQCVYCFIF